MEGSGITGVVDAPLLIIKAHCHPDIEAGVLPAEVEGSLRSKYYHFKNNPPPPHFSIEVCLFFGISTVR